MSDKPNIKELLTIEQWQAALLLWLEHHKRIQVGMTWYQCRTRINEDNSMLVEIWKSKT